MLRHPSQQQAYAPTAKPDGALDRLADQHRELCERLAAQGEHVARIAALAQAAHDRVVRNHRVPRRESVVITPAPTVLHPEDFRYAHIYCASGSSLIVVWRGISLTITTANGWNALNVGDGAELTVALVANNFNAVIEYSDEKLP